MNIEEYISSGIVEMYVQGLCSPAEKLELEMLRKREPKLDVAIKKYEEAIENTFLQNSITVPEKTDAAILNKISSLQKPAPVINIAESKPAVKKRSWIKYVAAASVALLVVSGVYNYFSYKKIQQQTAWINNYEQQLPPGTVLRTLDNPDIITVKMEGVIPHAICHCTMFVDIKTGKAYMMIHHLVPTNGSGNYQLWAYVDNKPVSVGTFDDSVRGRFIEISGIPQGSASFTVTLEKTGGSNTPSTDVFLKGVI